MARVLVVEDDADLARLLLSRLRSYGHYVLHAPSGRIAMTLVGLDFPAEVVLLDVNLPGIDGFALLEELRRHPELDNPNLPAVFLSADKDPEKIARAKELGVAFLGKPFVSGELQGAILKAAGEVLEEA